MIKLYILIIQVLFGSIKAQEPESDKKLKQVKDLSIEFPVNSFKLNKIFTHQNLRFD